MNAKRCSLFFLFLPVVVKDDEVVRPHSVVPMGKQRGKSCHRHLLRVPESHSQDIRKKDKKREEYALWRQFNEKPSFMPGCPGEPSGRQMTCGQEQDDAYWHCLHKSHAGLKTL